MKTLLVLGFAALLGGCAVEPYYTTYDYPAAPYVYGYGPYDYAPGYYYGPTFGFSYFGGHSYGGHRGDRDRGRFHADAGRQWHSSASAGRWNGGMTQAPRAAAGRAQSAPRAMSRGPAMPEQRHTS